MLVWSHDTTGLVTLINECKWAVVIFSISVCCLEVGEKLVTWLLRVIGELLLLHPHVGAADGRVLARQQEDLLVGAGHQEPHLVLQLRDQQIKLVRGRAGIVQHI